MYIYIYISLSVCVYIYIYIIYIYIRIMRRAVRFVTDNMRTGSAITTGSGTHVWVCV